VGAVFAFPLRVGAVRIGAMTLYGLDTGPLGEERLADALTMADVIAHEILVIQSGATAGLLADDLAAVGEYRAEIHQASGMVSIQVDVSVADALVRLRAHAFSTGRPLRQVAADVVARRMRLEA
jgi:AmiR/NasT family two-component response regulator